MSRAFATDLRDSDEYEATPDLLALYAKPDGEWVNEGDRIVQPGLAAALSGIGLRGGAYMNMSHKQEERQLKSSEHRAKIVAGITAAVERHFGQQQARR